MELHLESRGQAALQALRTELAALVADADLQDTLRAGEVTAQAPDEARKGDPVTMFTVLVAAVGAGGALTVALSKEGFLSQLARVLEKYISGGEVTVKLKKTPKTEEIELSGSARQIEKMFAAYLKNQR